MPVPNRLAAETQVGQGVNGLTNFVYQRMPVVSGLPTMDPTPTGSTALYNVPIGQALDLCGYTPANPSAVTDADVAALPASDWYKFVEVARYFLIQFLLGSYTLTDVTVQDGQEDWATLRKGVSELADRIAARYPALLGPNRNGYLFSGATGFNFTYGNGPAAGWGYGLADRDYLERW